MRGGSAGWYSMEKTGLLRWFLLFSILSMALSLGIVLAFSIAWFSILNVEHLKVSISVHSCSLLYLESFSLLNFQKYL